MKTFTGVCVAVGLVILLGWPALLGPRPQPTDPLAVRRAYATRMTGLFGVLTLAFVGGTVGSLLIVRRAKREYRNAAQTNADDLLMGVVDDIERHESE